MMGETQTVENHFLDGNEEIKRVIEQGVSQKNPDAMQAILEVIQERMKADGHFLIPVEYPDENDKNTFLMRSVPGENGEGLYLVAFTDEEEVHKGSETAILSNFMDVFLENAIDEEAVRGIVINPWSNACQMPKTAIQYILQAKNPRENDYERENYLLSKAIRFATDFHSGQLRKGTTRPYILHPLETLDILNSMKADTNLLMAGVLHDTIEDTAATTTDILERFGFDVATLVSAHSEDKSKTWEERKAAAITDAANSEPRLQMLILADKVSNLRSMVRDYRELGDELWERFNAPKENQSWYYSGLEDALEPMQYDENASQIYWEMDALYKALFVSYYYDSKSEMLYQCAAHGEAYRLVKGESSWESCSDEFLEFLEEIPQFDAEMMADEWMSGL